MFLTIFPIAISFYLVISLFAAHIADALERQYQATSDSGNVYKMGIEPGITEVMKPLPATITVSDQNGVPISGVKLSCSLTMPAMAML